MKKLILMTALISFGAVTSFAQLVPSEAEQITHLVTFGPNSKTSWGDDDYSQVFFFIIPESFTKPVYIRVFDPDIGGKTDEKNKEWNTSTRFRVYGGKGTFSNPDARKVNPVGKYDAGLLLASKVFGQSASYDGKWYSFGPFNPLEGEKVDELRGRVFKIIADGKSGDDGNLYKYFLSTQANENKSVEGSNAFTYEYSFRLPEQNGVVSHLYPFIDKDVSSITQHNFDYDKEGSILIYSIAKNRHRTETSGNMTWGRSKHMIEDEERNTTIDLQIAKGRTSRNDMVCYITNQYDDAVAFFSVPVGGPPKFKYKIKVNYKKGNEK